MTDEKFISLLQVLAMYTLGLLARSCEATLASFLFHIVTTEMFVKAKNIEETGRSFQ